MRRNKAKWLCCLIMLPVAMILAAPVAGAQQNRSSIQRSTAIIQDAARQDQQVQRGISIDPRNEDLYRRDRSSYGFANIWTDRQAYYPGDPVRVYFTVARDAHVYVFSTDSDGVTHQIFPNYYDRNNSCQRGRTYSIPSAGYRLTITPPVGIDSLQIIAYPRRWRFMGGYLEFSLQDPFPQRRGGAKAMLELYRNEAKQNARSLGGRGAGNAGVKTDQKSGVGIGVQRGIGVQGGISIDLVPFPPADYYEAWTSYQVRGYPPYRTWPENERQRRMRADGRMKISSSPNGAQVYVDGRYLGRTPLRLKDLGYGEYHVRVEKFGYHVEERLARIFAPATLQLNFLLLPRSRPPTLFIPPPPRMRIIIPKPPLPNPLRLFPPWGKKADRAKAKDQDSGKKTGKKDEKGNKVKVVRGVNRRVIKK